MPKNTPFSLQELRARLEEEGVSSSAFSLDGSGNGECYCIRETSANWEVFYSERGHRNNLVQFKTFVEAAAHFMACVLDDETTRCNFLAWFSDRARADDFVAILKQAGITPNHRDAPPVRDAADIRYRVFVNGPDLERARAIRDSFPGANAG